MASDLSFVEYVSDQISGAGRITHRKMFGEYAIYCEGKVVALVCDNQLFIKPTPAARAMLEPGSEAPPFPGAKPYLLLGDRLDDREFAARVIRVTWSELPEVKVKAAAKKRGGRK